LRPVLPWFSGSAFARSVLAILGASVLAACTSPGSSTSSQSLIERLARLIDSLEQDEGDPDRLSNLFAMDHLVTRMRRNSENLLLLAGHEGARRWSEPVSLTDVARAATSEIEEYSRVTLKIQPGIAVTGSAVSDIVHLLAEIIENATIFSAKHTPVQVSAGELATGGVLIDDAAGRGGRRRADAHPPRPLHVLSRGRR
jgi:hypothetical protein